MLKYCLKYFHSVANKIWFGHIHNMWQFSLDVKRKVSKHKLKYQKNWMITTMGVTLDSFHFLPGFPRMKDVSLTLTFPRNLLSQFRNAATQHSLWCVSHFYIQHLSLIIPGKESHITRLKWYVGRNWGSMIITWSLDHRLTVTCSDMDVCTLWPLQWLRHSHVTPKCWKLCLRCLIWSVHLMLTRFSS